MYWNGGGQSVHLSIHLLRGARHSSGPWESSRAETDKLPAFVEGLAINMKANRHWKEQQVRRAGGRGDASGEGSGEASEKGSVS